MRHGAIICARFASRYASRVTLLIAALAAAPAAQAQQFTQQGSKLLGTGASATAEVGAAVALSADGNTLLVGGPNDDNTKGAGWVYTRNSGTWTQQGGKLIGTGITGAFAAQGTSVALSADGNTAVLGGYFDNAQIGAAWVFTRASGVWTQQGGKLVGTGNSGASRQGVSVAISADGNTIAVGGNHDSSNAGAAWVFTRSGGTWTQQGSKLVGTGTIGAFAAEQGIALALSADGNTLAVGGHMDDFTNGATWIFTRSNNAWTQQARLEFVPPGGGGNIGQGRAVSLSADGNVLLTCGTVSQVCLFFLRSGSSWSASQSAFTANDKAGASQFGVSVSLSADGNLAIIGGYGDNANIGAAWIFQRVGGGATWLQIGTKKIGTGNSGPSEQGLGVALSGDGGTAAVGGFHDNNDAGAVWLYAQPVLSVSPKSNIAAQGNIGGPFSPPSFDYSLSTPVASVFYSVSGVPDWLTATSTSGTATNQPTTLSFTVNANAATKPTGVYGPTAITVSNATNGQGNTTFNATLAVGANGVLTVVSAVLPASRSVQVGTAATAFSTIINTSATTATSCGLGFNSSAIAGFKFQTTDPATNAVTGTLNAPANIPAGGAQSYVFAVTPGAAFAPIDIPITAGCANSGPAPIVVGLNTLLLSASATPVPDIVALAATTGNDGIVNVAGANGTGAFAVATVNVGAASGITASADTGGAALPVAINMCQTNPASGQCTSAVGPTVTTTIAANDTPTFAIFLQGSGNVPFDPAHNRVFVRFKDGGGVVRGATSVAVRTQ